MSKWDGALFLSTSDETVVEIRYEFEGKLHGFIEDESIGFRGPFAASTENFEKCVEKGYYKRVGGKI